MTSESPEMVGGDLDALLNEHFAGKIVRKDLTKLVKEGANVPVFVLEYLLGSYCASQDEEVVSEGLQTVKRVLAENFVRPDEAEKVKSLIREIVRSQTYQQAAQTATEDDPDNQRLRHQNRRPAPAETLRDSILAIAGELDREARKSMVEPLGKFAIATSGSRHESLAKTGKLRQRSIYMPFVRGAAPPSLAVFDLPNPDLVTGKRADTTGPAQALFMMNSPFVRDMAQAVSTSLAKEDLTIGETIQQLYRRILIRDADSSDMAMAQDYIQDGKSPQAALASFVQILFSSTEFRFIE